MSLNGFDMASYQTGLEPAKVPCDFVVVKATQGTTYLNPDFARAAKAVIAAGKLLGIYHYAAGGDPAKEAEFFISKISGYVGKALLALDWEGEQNPSFGKNDVKWCKAFMDRIREMTGVVCFVYMSKSVCRAKDWTDVARTYPLWCAQYASNRETGYQGVPWTDNNGFGAWKGPAIYQYSSSGKLSGWQGRLDLNIAYFSVADWKAYAKGSVKVEKQDVLYPDLTDTELAVEVWYGVHGDNSARRAALGSRYAQVQASVEVIGQSTANFVTANKAYLKKHGHDRLIAKA